MLILISIFVRRGILSDNAKPVEDPASFGDAIKNTQEAGAAVPQEVSRNSNQPESSQAEKQNFSIFLKQMSDCLKLKLQVPDLSSPQLETLLQLASQEYGAPTFQDRWMNWHIHNQEGQERRIRLVIDPDGTGGSGRELRYYAVDSEGLPVPIPFPTENVQTHNPSAEVINSLLKEGEVFYKEKASSATFNNGLSMQYTEKNDMITEFEANFGNVYFKCSNIKSPLEGCRCLN